MEKMKTADVYREARKILSPWCKENGFKRCTGSMLGWFKEVHNQYLIFWLQCSRGEPWDDYAGSKFIVEFQYSSSTTIGEPGEPYRDYIRNRFPHFLSENDLQEVREIQNSIIRSHPEPSRSYLVEELSRYQLDQETVDWKIERYLKQFREIKRPYKSSDDIWLRYAQPEDIHRWAEFLVQVLPKIVDQFTEMSDQSLQNTEVCGNKNMPSS